MTEIVKETYFAIVKTDKSQKFIIDIKIPELHFCITSSELHKKDVLGTIDEIQKLLTQYLNKKFKEKIIIPPPSPLPQSYAKNTFPLPIIVEFERQKKGIFARLFPFIGTTINLLSGVVGVIVNIEQLENALASTSNPGLAARGWAWGQAIFNNALGVVFYHYLKSGQSLEKIGSRVDQYFSGFKPLASQNLEPKVPISGCRSTVTILMKLGICTAVVGNAIGNAIGTEGDLGATEARAEQNGVAIPGFTFAEWTLILCGGISGLIIVGKVFAEFAAYLESMIRGGKPDLTNEERRDLEEIIASQDATAMTLERKDTQKATETNTDQAPEPLIKVGAVSSDCEVGEDVTNTCAVPSEDDGRGIGMSLF